VKCEANYFTGDWPVKWRFHISPGSFSAFNIDTSPGSFLICLFLLSAFPISDFENSGQAVRSGLTAAKDAPTFT
jgi:hypothetical protein